MRANPPRPQPPPPTPPGSGCVRRCPRSTSASRTRPTDHADTYGVVETICRNVRTEFGPDFQMTLRIYRDLEFADDTYLQLRVTRPESSPEKLLDRIHALAEAHEDLWYDKSGHLVVIPFYPRRG